jgi:cell division protein FtsB
MIWLLLSSLASFALGYVFARNRASEHYDAANRAYSDLCDAKDQVINSQKEKDIAMDELHKSHVELIKTQETLIQALSGERDALEKLIQALKEERDALKEFSKSQLELDEAQRTLIRVLTEERDVLKKLNEGQVELLGIQEKLIKVLKRDTGGPS